MTHDDIKETNSEVLRIMSSVFTDMATSNEIADTCRTIEKMSFMLCNELRHQKKNPASFDDEYIKTLSAVSPIHDIGKVVIPQEILNKPGRLKGKGQVVLSNNDRGGVSEKKSRWADKRAALF
jgi:response regulator RpfG family c-di-GMP phosphodiesterase